MYYLAEYLERVDIAAPRRWTMEESPTLSDEVLCGKGISCKLKATEHLNISMFFIYNSQYMERFSKEY
ncbi:hypothetical protein GOP47_0014340 [Adiantum capillus-veneris]|uniref:Uncharacterized protein n=1 Tax=Adiantum capillus-veneris TaxID=13818 RepID=A0A9D4ZDE6_ADICA|nr:hypothetical protein GOP47_0014340 [Adiantum capillus-veneris]